jgi:orotate phosphoribosyltransferase
MSNSLQAQSDTQTKFERLKTILKEKSFRKGDFVLASGARSDHFFDVKVTLLDPEGANLAAELILERLGSEVEAVGGLELGACPIVSAVCVKSYQLERPIRSFYVRKATKGRGTNQRIEGCSLSKGDKVVIMEDVTTSGGSAMDAVRIVQELGCEVVSIFTIVDRLQGARENLEKEGIALESLYTREDFF